MEVRCRTTRRVVFRVQLALYHGHRVAICRLECRPQAGVVLDAPLIGRPAPCAGFGQAGNLDWRIGTVLWNAPLFGLKPGHLVVGVGHWFGSVLDERFHGWKEAPYGDASAVLEDLYRFSVCSPADGRLDRRRRRGKRFRLAVLG
jgi:hypothetical protein